MGTLKQRIEEAEAAGFTNGQLARAAGVTSGAVSQWKSGAVRSIKATAAAGLERLTGWRAAWWADGKLPKEVISRKPVFQAHPVRPNYEKFDAPLISIRNLMDGDHVGEYFQTEIEDESMAPDFAPGTRILWSSSRQARPGRIALVRDAHGMIHVREYRQGIAPGAWLAAPRNVAFATLDSATQDLEILGVKWGVIDADD